MTCKKCNGFGYTQEEGAFGIPTAVQCECVLKKALDKQAEKAWTNLSKVPIKKKSPLNGKVDESLLINADISSLQVHLRAALADFSQPNRFIKVVNDATIMSAWLSNIGSGDIADPDYQRDIMARSLEDLAESPYLLIIRLGVKMARNSAMSEVLHETIELRNHLHKPTWIVEEPSKPLQEGHLSWSRAVADAIMGWEVVRLDLPQRLDRMPTTQPLSVSISSSTISNGSLPAASHKRVKL